MMDSTMDSDGSSDDERISAQTVLQALEDAWLNEKFSPELLPHRSDYVDCMLEQISAMETNLNRVEKTDFRAEVHLMELARIRYIITSYLRTRLEKIEQFAFHILEQDQQRPIEESYLTEGEKQFALQYLQLNETLFSNLVLSHLPQHFQDFTPSQSSLVPDQSSHVFLRANTNVEGVVVEGDGTNQEEEIDLGVSSQHICQYKHVASLVKSGAVQLI